MPLSAGDDFAGYTIVRLLGAGGMGEVYLAKHPRLNRHDALKILPARLSSDGDFRRRFEREADLAAALWHPDIVGVHDRGEFDGQLWISMDYVDGTDAAELCRSRYPNGMPIDEVAEIVAAIGAALDFAHQRGLLHRDVKPANILLTRPETGTRRILLADFGIARDVNDTNRLTATSMTLGTLSYCAPEQLAGDRIDGRADQYALAATAYQLLTGSAPFDDPSPAVVISRQLYSPVPPISAIRPELAALDAVFARALAKNPADRFRTCQDFAAALHVGAGQPTRAAPPRPAQAHPPSPPQPPPTSRRSLPVAAVVGLVVAGAALAGVLLWFGLHLVGRDRGTTAATTATPPSTPIHLYPPTVTASPRPDTASPTPSPTPSPRMLLPDADEQGFLTGGARCRTGDRAELVLRTAYSTAVVCATPAQQLYYRGARSSDGATIELTDVARSPAGFVAINYADPTSYEVTHHGLRIVHDGQLISDEPALESAP